jgi:hypothetical protein
MAIFLISLLVVTCLTIYAFTSKSQPNQVVKESKPLTSAQLKPKIIIGGGDSDAKIQEIKYFCIKDKGYHTSVWPKDYDQFDVVEFSIAGISFRDNIDKYVGEFVGVLDAEPTNPYDANAIKVLAGDGHHVGYVPKDMTAEVRKAVTLPCPCFCYIGKRNGIYFSCCYIPLKN